MSIRELTPREKAQAAQRARKAREIEEASRSRTGIPDGWRRISLIAYTDGRHYIITEQPGADLPCDYPYDDPNAHSCDEMGCGIEHVLARFTLPSEPTP